MICKCGCGREISSVPHRRKREFFDASCRKRWQRKQIVTSQACHDNDLGHDKLQHTSSVFLGIKLSEGEIGDFRRICRLNIGSQTARGHTNLVYVLETLLAQLDYSLGHPIAGGDQPGD